MTTDTNSSTQITAISFSVIMVLSMVAGGVAGLAGTTTAQTSDPTDVDFIVDGQTNPNIVYEGQTVRAVDIQADTEYVLRSVDEYDGDEISSSTFEAEYETDSNGNLTIDTGGLDPGDYFLRGPDLDETRDNTFELAVQELSIDWEASTYDTGEEEAELNVESRRNNYNLNISADGLDYDELEALFGGNSNNDPVNNVSQDAASDDDEIIVRGFRDDSLIADFSNADIDPGEYEFTAEVTDTDAEDTASVTIESEDVDADFAESITTDAAGDVVEITVELEDSDSAFVSIGGNNVGFFDVVYIEDDDDDGDVTFQVNTRTLGTDAAADAYSSADDIVETNAADEGATFEDADGDPFDDARDFRTSSDGLDHGDLIRPLQPIEYNLIVSNGDFSVNDDGDLVVENERDIATLDLTEPSVGDVTIHTAPAGATDDADNVDELLEIVTPRENIAINDRMVIQIEADGIEGYVAQSSDASLEELNEGINGDALTELVDDDNNQGVNFAVESTTETTNQGPATLDFSETTVYFGDGQFFVVADTSSGDSFDRSISNGNSFDVTYEYVIDDDSRYRFDDSTSPPGWDSSEGDDSFPYFAAGESVTAEAEFTLEDRQVSFDNTNSDGLIEVAVDEEAGISGTTNVAPGTDISIRMRSANDVSPRFILTDNDAEIDDDGVVSATFDTTTGTVGDEASISFRVGGTSVEGADAILVESVGDGGGDGDDSGNGDDSSDDGGDGDDGTDGSDGDDDGSDGDGDDGGSGDDGDDGADGGDGDDGGDGGTDDTTPGFGALVALVALIAAALLATRRNE